jgi:hypothetical protein
MKPLLPLLPLLDWVMLVAMTYSINKRDILKKERKMEVKDWVKIFLSKWT